jgi:serine/threonine-protein phosphatase 2A regulatory subunit A
VSIIERMPLFAEQLGPSFFQERLSALCVSLLTDSVFAVREAAVLNLGALCKALGPQWSLNHLLPKLLPLAKHERYFSISSSSVILKVVQFSSLSSPFSPAFLCSYLSRNVALDGIGKLALAIGAEAAAISLSTLQKAAADKVPNVRFNAIKALRFVAPLLPPQEVAGGVLPIIKNLAASDSDVDVRFPLFVYACILFEFMLSDRCNFLPQML